MKRRHFGKQLSIGALASLTGTGLWGSHSPQPSQHKLIKPKRLKKGDTIGLITPGSYIDDESLEKAISNMEEMGFLVKMGEHIRAERGFNAGTDKERLEDLHTMFADEEVAGIWCARGGYGCSRLLPMINYELIKKHPKALIGYSDITALLNAIQQETGLVGFHGPVAASTFTDYNRIHLDALLMNPRPIHQIDMMETEPDAEKHNSFTPEVIRDGVAEGALVGGNLSLLAAMIGTPYAIDVKDKILFVEEIGEKPYRIDRMLTQMRQAYDLNQTAGILLGVFEDCQPKEDDRSLSLMETLRDRLGDLKVPVLYGFSFGHIRNQCTLPVGIRARMNTAGGTVTLLEAGVE
ncbi:MAG: putative murein peptide carboxypeptidase [Saprospiraceae bacterium]|nr:MAG: putative murein peptide carboxypeptidase [Saprospiraceae bacterium]